MTLASGATINVDANEVTSLLADEAAGRLTINDQIITVNNPITVDQANSLAATTTGVVTATILSTESIEELGTLDAVGDNISIIIPDGSATASQLITLAQSTTALVDASAVTKLASDNIDNIEKLLTAGNDITQFTSDSFSLLANVSVSDTTLDVSLLNEAIVQANLATDATSTLFNIADANTINGGTEIDFTKLLTNETSNQVDISDQNLTVDTGTLSVSNANLLDATTSGIVTANIATDSTVDSLATLTGTGNAYTIVIGSGDATGSNASDLIAIDNATTVAVDASSITELTGSNTDIATLYASAGVSNLGDENITITNDLTVAEANAIDLLTTGVVSASIASTVDVGTLGDLTGTNSYTYVLPGGTPLTVSDLNGIIDSISIDVDASGVTSLTGDFNDVVGIYNSSKVNGLEDKDINITSDLTVDEANSLDLLTSGIVSGSIITTERVAELVTLTGLNAYSIIIPSVDALSTTAADLKLAEALS